MRGVAGNGGQHRVCRMWSQVRIFKNHQNILSLKVGWTCQKTITLRDSSLSETTIEHRYAPICYPVFDTARIRSRSKMFHAHEGCTFCCSKAGSDSPRAMAGIGEFGSCRGCLVQIFIHPHLWYQFTQHHTTHNLLIGSSLTAQADLPLDVRIDDTTMVVIPLQK